MSEQLISHEGEASNVQIWQSLAMSEHLLTLAAAQNCLVHQVTGLQAQVTSERRSDAAVLELRLVAHMTMSTNETTLQLTTAIIKLNY